MEIIDNVYPYNYLLFEIVNNVKFTEEMTPAIRETVFKPIKLNNDNLFNRNKLIASVIFLQLDDIYQLIDTADLDTIDTCIDFVTKDLTYKYPYMFNSEKHLIIAKLLLDKLKNNVISIQNFLDKYAMNVYETNKMNFRLNKFIKNNDSFPYVNNNYKMMELLQQYDTTTDNDNTCKFCLSSVPIHMLVKPCKCNQPVHIYCFKRWFDIAEKKCEICNDNYSRKNEIRIKSDMGMKKIDTEIFFPFDNFYPRPLMCYNESEDMGDNNAHCFALLYLQLARMEDLLKKNNTNIKQKLGQVLHYFANGSMPSNYLINNNRKAYIDMTNLLKKYKVIENEAIWVDDELNLKLDLNID